MPKLGFLPMTDPVEVDRPPTGPGWAHEVKWDGYRVQAHKDDDQVRIFARKANDWTVMFEPDRRRVGRAAGT